MRPRRCRLAIQNAKTLDRDGVRDALDTIDGLELPSGKMTMDPTTRNPIKGGRHHAV